MLALLQMNWERIAERFGLPIVGFALLTLFVVGVLKKYIGPYIQARMARADAKEDQVHALLTEQLKYEREQAELERKKTEVRIEKAERLEETLLRDFKASLDESNRVSRRVAEGLDELLRRK